jgi:hypothetical protein
MDGELVENFGVLIYRRSPDCSFEEKIDDIELQQNFEYLVFEDVGEQYIHLECLNFGEWMPSTRGGLVT